MYIFKNTNWGGNKVENNNITNKTKMLKWITIKLTIFMVMIFVILKKYRCFKNKINTLVYFYEIRESGGSNHM